MTPVTELHQRLYANPIYRDLSAKRRKLALAVIVEGKPFGTACREFGLHSSRERADIDLACLLAEFAPEAASTVDPKKKGVGFDSEADEVMWAFHELLDRMGARSYPQTKIPSDEAVYAAEIVGGQLRTIPEAGLDAQKIARMVGECRKQVLALSARMQAIHDRKAELQARAICDSCQGLMTEPRSIAGIHVYCAPGGAIWQKTGTVPHGAKA